VEVAHTVDIKALLSISKNFTSMHSHPIENRVIFIVKFFIAQSVVIRGFLPWKNIMDLIVNRLITERKCRASGRKKKRSVKRILRTLRS